MRGLPNRFGTSTNYTQFEQDGTLVMNGNATVWLDQLNDALSLKTVGVRIVTNDADGTLDYNTQCSLTDYSHCNIQLNHNRKLTSTISPHIHWFQTSSNIPNFMLQYRWQKNGLAKETSWTNYKCNTVSYTYTSGTIHQICMGTPINAVANDGISDIVQFRIIRDNANTSTLFSGADPLNATVGIISFDVHIECDTIGSRTITTK